MTNTMRCLIYSVIKRIFANQIHFYAYSMFPSAQAVKPTWFFQVVWSSYAWLERWLIYSYRPELGCVFKAQPWARRAVWAEAPQKQPSKAVCLKHPPLLPHIKTRGRKKIYIMSSKVVSDCLAHSGQLFCLWSKRVKTKHFWMVLTSTYISFPLSKIVYKPRPAFRMPGHLFSFSPMKWKE